MAEYDTAIRFSVLIVLRGILRHLVSKLIRSSPTCDGKMIKDGQVVIRARNLNVGANFIPLKSFRTRRFYLSNEENGLLHVPKDQAAQNPQAHMFSDPNMAMDMMNKNLSMIIPLALTFAVSSRSRSVSSYTDTHLPEAIWTEILARLPLRSISRFKSVCRTWKSATESVYFRRLFVSLHQNTSSCWSLVVPDIEFIDFHGCQTWGLPNSIGSYIQNAEIRGKFDYVGSSNGLVLMNAYDGASYVGNPVLQQWVEIPCPPSAYVTLLSGLLTRVDDDGVVLSFKVVRTAAMKPSEDRSSTCLCYWVYSSETGIWTRKRLHCPHYFTSVSPPMSLHGTLYLPSSGFDDLALPRALIAHDFYGESNLCRVVPFPEYNPNHNRDFKRAFTTSTGFVMYITTLPHNVLKVWKLLNNNDLAWQLDWEIRLPFDDISYYAPLAMHPFDRHIVYLWCQQNRYLVSCNLQTQNYKIFGEDQSVDDDLRKCFVNQSICEEFMDSIFGPYSYPEYQVSVPAFQSMLPRWMEPMPCPPQVEMVDTTWLRSYIASKPRKNRGK